MDKNLQKILNIIQKDKYMSAEEKNELSKATKETSKELTRVSSKLKKTERTNQTTSNLLDKKTTELIGKNRELEIEAALERVRSRMLRMQKSIELEETTAVMYQQLDALGVVPEGSMVYIVIIDTNTDTAIQWIVTDRTLVRPPEGELRVPMTEDPRLIRTYEAWKRKDPLLIRDLGGDELDDFKKYIKSLPSFQEIKSEIDQWPERLVWSEASFSNGTLGFICPTPLPAATLDILVRFSKDFDLTYTRFLDLQKAEAQTREAQIENAMEKVRSRTMAMQRSEELADVATVLFQQVKALGIPQWTCGFTIWEIGDKESIFYPGSPDGEILPPCRLPLNEHPVFMKFDESRRRGDDLYIYEKEGEVQEDHYRYMLALPGGVGDMLQGMLDADLTFPTFQIDHLANFSHGNLIFITYEHFPEMHDIFKRFAKVFEQTYTRFLDLQKAEEQAKEAQIEVALEKVRSRSMAMHKSEELLNVIKVVSEQLLVLNFKFDNVSFGQNNQEHDYNFWLSARGYPDPVQISVPFLDNPIINSLMEAHKNNVSFLTNTFSPKDSKEWFQHLIDHGHLAFLPEATTNYILNSSFTRSSAILENIQLFVGRYGTEPYSDDENKIIARFAQVFEQSFTRFLDLQKAEEQAKEAQIETALERVRSRSLAMHKTEELLEVIIEVFSQFQKLNMDTHACWIDILKKGSNDFNLWIATPEGGYPTSLAIPYIDNPIFNDYIKAKKSKTLLANSYTKPIKDVLYSHFFKQPALRNAPKERIKFIMDAPGTIFSASITDHIGFGMTRYNKIPFSDKENELLIRFTKEFDQSYTRFLDLQKAEAQAREAQIEAALEKVRSRTIGMQQSEELQDAAMILFEQVEALGVQTFVSGFNIWEEDKKYATAWMAGKHRLQAPFKTNTAEDIYLPIFEAEQRGEPLFIKEQGGEKLEAHYKYLTRIPEVKAIEEEMSRAGVSFPDFQIIHCAFFSKGYLMFISYEPVPEAHDIFKRFAKVFEQTYTRFLDLQKAETQVREAQIETSLERVRAKAMAMHSSEDLITTASQLFKEFNHLDISFIRCGVLRIHESREAEVYAYSRTEEDDTVAVFGDLKMTGHEFIDGVFEHWKLQKEYIHELKGNAVKRYYKLVTNQANIPISDLKKNLFGHAFYFPEGCLYCFANEKLPEDILRIMRKFKTVMGLTYRRYFELQESEARELTAIKESSLDRVRAEIASMRTSTDLERITPLIWKELTALGVSFYRCGVFIIEEDAGMVSAYLSVPTGESLAALHLDLDTNSLTKAAFKSWKEQKIHQEVWTQQQFVDYTKSMMDLGQIKDPETFQQGKKAPEKLSLHLAPFKQGMLYVGSTTTLSQEQIELVQSLADTFAEAYARYEDFNQLEDAKAEVENTLTDLKSAQSQLIQSEKMASLGELTAGIAHEIQNPLNFVTNFSEVSEEMLEELSVEIKNNSESAIEEIMTDIKQNLSKINHHGKRASSIVKGMLDHSRTSSGVKELTDINVLADEYLRLAYHGLRAKDKSFQAEFTMDLDRLLPKTSIIPQDFGRVILNLINNAFYTVNKKGKIAANGYKPTVSVSTGKIEGAIKITIKDNGEGISKEITEKIFQPFFTTKPSGEGTGLGLSLAYDIVTKGHGGTLTVDSKKGDYTEFIIELPVKSSNE